jgi:hypothetical protein
VVILASWRVSGQAVLFMWPNGSPWPCVSLDGSKPYGLQLCVSKNQGEITSRPACFIANREALPDVSGLFQFIHQRHRIVFGANMASAISNEDGVLFAQAEFTGAFTRRNLNG